MGRSIIIKLAILLVVATLVYSVFWFFKVGQVEKQINKFVSDNSSYVSVEEVTVSDFPLSQKITIKNLKFTIPNAALDKNEVIIPHLEATAGIFASEYIVTLTEPVSVQDADGNIANVEFTQTPQITVAITDGNVSQFSYQDSGYKILAADKSVTYAASSTTVLVKSEVAADKTTHLINVSAKEIEGFDIMNLYKNVLEKKVVDGIKTGEITLNSPTPAPTDPTDLTTTQPETVVAAGAPATVPTVAPTTVTPTPTPATVAQGAPPATPTTIPAPVTPVTTAAAQAVPVQATATTDATTDPATTSPIDAAALPPVAAPIPAAISDTSIVRSDLTLNVEYVLTPVAETGQQANTPPDPIQIQEVPTQNNKLVKINSLEFTNLLYTISVSGKISSLPDDNLPSGGITIKIDKIDNLINQIVANFTQMADKMKPVAEIQPTTDLLSGTAAATVEDPYQVFLTRVSTGLAAVTKEIAAKNVASKDAAVQLDLRREKNLDFLINETSMREILGKF